MAEVGEIEKFDLPGSLMDFRRPLFVPPAKTIAKPSDIMDQYALQVFTQNPADRIKRLIEPISLKMEKEREKTTANKTYKQ